VQAVAHSAMAARQKERSMRANPCGAETAFS
jgi:hypothetical protein